MIGKRTSKPRGKSAQARDENDMSSKTEFHLDAGSQPSESTERGAAAAGATQQEWLRRSLKKLYEDTAQDPVPDSFIELLEELDRKEREGK